VWAITFSPNGEYLGTASEDCTAGVWDYIDGRQIAQFLYKNIVWDVKFSPDGSYLATASWDNTASIWNILKSQQTACFTHDDRVMAVAFSPNGKYLATASEDHTAQIWQWQPDDIITEVCSRLTRNLTPEEWRQYIGDEPYSKTCPNLP
jgi:WD40 repeat protein